MKGYGQFCPMALAAEIVGERWTLLVLRELMKGATRFNEIHRGVPRMSPTLLVKRLRTLEGAGIVTRASEGDEIAYGLSEAGENLLPVVESLAGWGKAWLPARLSDDNADPDLLMWDLHRSMDCTQMPQAQIVIRFDFEDQPRARRWRWVLGSSEGAQLCITDPGLEVDLFVTTDCVTMVRIWHGDTQLQQAIDAGAVTLDGPPRLRSAFPRWIRPSSLADVPRRSA
jgi:DNA-binding HxlR family transcriptional regulator